MRKIFVAVVSACLFSGTVDVQKRTLWDTVREHDPSSGPVQVVISISYEPKDVSALLSEADSVFEGTIVHMETGLDETQTAILTTYRLRPRRTLFVRDAGQIPGRGETVTFRHVGGTMEMLGQKVVMNDDKFRQLKINENVVVFLKRVDGALTHYVVGGPYGCFTLRGTRLAAMDVSVAQSVQADLEGADV